MAGYVGRVFCSETNAWCVLAIDSNWATCQRIATKTGKKWERVFNGDVHDFSIPILEQMRERTQRLYANRSTALRELTGGA